MGRRGVQQLTPTEWREALEQQIREKEQQKQQRFSGGIHHEEKPERRSHSAPQQQEDGELIPSGPGLERAATTAACDRQTEDSQVAGRRRRFQQLSREEYLKGLQEQVDEKKRLTQEAQEKERSRRRRVSRSEEDEDSAARGKGRGDDGRVESKDMGKTRDNLMVHSELQNKLEDAKPTAASNQHEVEPCQPSLINADVATPPDPVAIAKIVDFCEELKQQNEDVKRQLLEQHAVLASLHSTFTIEADGSSPVAASRQRNSASSVKKSQAKRSEAKTTAALPMTLRPRPTRGETKIPLPRMRDPTSLRSAGANIVKRLVPETTAQPLAPHQRAEAKVATGDRADNTPDKKTSDSLTACMLKEVNVQLNEIEANNSSTIQDCINSHDRELAEPKDGAKEEFSSPGLATGVSMKIIRDADEMNACHFDDECPMDAESKLVHDWASEDIGDKLLNCTSISILDGPSSLVSLDQRVTDLFL